MPASYKATHSAYWFVRREKELDPVVKPQDMLAALAVTDCFYGQAKNSR